ncbi:4a-hydroxytetrahydrobiopterin dehydratase [Methylacidimicrobium cyclopophantes]|uniref:Putative pterin-4-alpha-carbinolamine dehydratase n=1 Tax=Methylacidimicrobium cyclopophantes TaxID=1041766 RepID=A0A5E6MKP8_9BACT|nr:4a-hydroxytetrahydrobiopterin dehydratase [Methylacidimicrobium cyclopophantes]VVM08559.1 4a-hydroxytetrahydrobiopterin dehydratase [Methylacidimicrobium cyclopophantes]
MKTTLTKERCVACRKDAPRLTDAEIAQLRKEVPLWKVEERDGIPILERVFSFPDFAAALRFTQRVGELAEQEGHHPAILTEWGKVTVSWWTHKIRGLHRNDFVMAAKTDGIYESSAKGPSPEG